MDRLQCWSYAYPIARTHQKVSTPLGARKTYSPTTAAIDVEAILRLLEGRWKLVTGMSPKMLAPQLRQLDGDGIVMRTVHHQVPPKVDYRLTEWGQMLCPALDALLLWAERRDNFAQPASSVRATRRSA